MDGTSAVIEIIIAVSVSSVLAICAGGVIYQRYRQRITRMTVSSETGAAWAAPVLPDDTIAYEPLVRQASDPCFSPPVSFSHRHSKSRAGPSDIRLLLSEDMEIFEKHPISREIASSTLNDTVLVQPSLRVPWSELDIESDRPDTVDPLKRVWSARWGARRVALLEGYSGPREVCSEAAALLRIGPHPHVATLLGISESEREEGCGSDPGPAGFLLVTEWAAFGRLDEVRLGHYGYRCG
jgi:hypothetical protein